jgi:HEAT repeat protein
VVEELLESLVDPRLAVRMEAVIAISHTKPDPRLTEALTNVLSGTELASSVVAAWSLGRLGDPSAIAALRGSLDSPVPCKNPKRIQNRVKTYVTRPEQKKSPLGWL